VASIKGYNNGFKGLFNTANYNSYLEASIKGYNDGLIRPFIEAQYNA
jgi:hypothetical protein